MTLLPFIHNGKTNHSPLHEVKYVSFALVVQKQHTIQKYHIILQVKSVCKNIWSESVFSHLTWICFKAIEIFYILRLLSSHLKKLFQKNSLPVG